MRILLLAVFVSVLAGALALGACGERRRGLSPDASDTAARAWKVAASFFRPDPEMIPSELATNPGSPHGEYLGSLSCKECHEEEYRKWRGSFHSRTLYHAVDGTVFGDFKTGKVYDDGSTPFLVRPYETVDAATGRKRYWMEIQVRPFSQGGPRNVHEADTYGAGQLPDLTEHPVAEVIHAFGNRRHQPYVGRWPDGQFWVLPIYWDGAMGEWRYDGFRAYVISCAHCHTTGIKHSRERLDPRQRRLQMTSQDELPYYEVIGEDEAWADGSVGCEVCHGPGGPHVRSVNSLGSEVYARRIADGTLRPTIYDGKRGSLERRTDLCGQCHNFMTESTVSWVPSPEGFLRAPRRDPIRLESSNLGVSFYADGSHMSPCTVVEVYRGSKMYAQGIGCSACHDPHGTDHWADLVKPASDNTLCTDCHDTLAAPEAQARHSRHAIGSPGNLCIECHMPRHMRFTNGVAVMSERLHSHAFSIPTGKQRPGGPPSACNICHDDRSHEWTRDTLAKWAREAEGPSALPSVKRSERPR
jgi:predicted CXXCH cytochrome family protein